MRSFLDDPFWRIGLKTLEFSILKSRSQCWSSDFQCWSSDFQINFMDDKYFKVYPLYIRQLVRKSAMLCIRIGHYGAIQILYYYYYYYLHAWRLYKRGRSHLKDKYLAVRRKCDNAISSFTQLIELKEARIVNSGNLGLLYKHINSKLTH